MKRKDYKNWGVMRIFLSYFRPHWKLFLLDMACAFSVALIDLAYPLISRSAMYDMLPQKAYRTFFVVMAVVVLAYVIRSLLQFVITYWGHIFGVRVEADIRRDLFQHLQTLGYCVWVSSTIGDSQFVKTSPLGTNPGSLT